MLSSRPHDYVRGFTLIELMVVVTIIGLLAAIAIPNYLRFQIRARRAEGAANVAAIRTGQLSYFGLWGTFASPENPNPSDHPMDGRRWRWNYGDPDWREIAFDPDGDVYFQYWTQGGEGTERSTFFVTATADLDQDETFACWAFLKPRNDPSGNLVFNLSLPEECNDSSGGALIRLGEVYLASGDNTY